MTTPSADNLELGQGHVFFDRFDFSTGVPVSTGIRHLGNVPSFSIQPQIEKIQAMTAMYAVKKVYKQVVRQVKSTGKATLQEFTPDNLSLAMMGKPLYFTRPIIDKTGVNSIEAKVPDWHNTYITLPDRWIDAASVVLKDSGGTAFMAGSYAGVANDYIVEPEQGRIFIPPGSNITGSGQLALVGSGSVTPGPLQIEYTAPAITAADKKIMIAGGTSPKIEGKLYFVGDPTFGPKYYAEFWHVSITPGGDIAMIGNEFATFDIAFNCFDKRAQHPGKPYYRVLQIK